jgi:hypothetical protein
LRKKIKIKMEKRYIKKWEREVSESKVTRQDREE